MQKYCFIATGGMLGAMSRLYIKRLPLLIPSDRFPLNILLINLLGSLILALFLTLALEVLNISPEIRLGVSTGFLGAFTTFSTFCKDSIQLAQNGSLPLAALYIFLSIGLGLAAAYLGVILAREIISHAAAREGLPDPANSDSERQ